MGGFEVLVPIFGISLFLVPIVGVTTILTLRYGLKPFMESLVKELREAGFAPDVGPRVQIQDLTDQIDLLAVEVRRLREGRDFDQRLLSDQSTPGGSPDSVS
jgi:hypothetical protein